jgi:hypothetical protein
MNFISRYGMRIANSARASEALWRNGVGRAWKWMSPEDANASPAERVLGGGDEAAEDPGARSRNEKPAMMAWPIRERLKAPSPFVEIRTPR